MNVSVLGRGQRGHHGAALDDGTRLHPRPHPQVRRLSKRERDSEREGERERAAGVRRPRRPARPGPARRSPARTAGPGPVLDERAAVPGPVPDPGPRGAGRDGGPLRGAALRRASGAVTASVTAPRRRPARPCAAAGAAGRRSRPSGVGSGPLQLAPCTRWRPGPLVARWPLGGEMAPWWRDRPIRQRPSTRICVVGLSVSPQEVWRLGLRRPDV
jgi:hypothetical protein